MPSYLFTVRMRRKVNGADFLLDHIESETAQEAEAGALDYLDGLGLMRSNYTAKAEQQLEVTEV